MPRSNPGRLLFRGVPSGRSLTIFNLVLVFGLCAVAAYMLLEMRREAGARADLTADNLVTILTRDVARNIELYDLSLLTVADILRSTGARNAAPEMHKRNLFGQANDTTNFGGLIVFDARGDVLLSSRPGRSFNARDRSYFGVHEHRDDVGLFIGAPVTSRFSGIDAVPLSRRLSNPDGSFAGVVAGAIHLAYFRQLFETVHLRPEDTITLLADDGTILMRRPYASGIVGQSVADSPSFPKMTAGRTGTFEGPALHGDGLRRFTFGKVGDLPLRVSIAMPIDGIYADWWRKAATLGTVVLVLCGGILTLTWLLRRELTQRIAAEARTAQVNVELETLAITDPLTGLWNRRRFDQALARDFRRAARRALPLSLLMIDVDCFKAFNDRYGHQRGDEALKLIAGAMAIGLDDRNATLCRIGGEEFAVILPETDLVGARLVAMRIRDAVMARGEPHEANPHGVVTVSIGGANRSATGSDDPAVLFEAADAVLYEAKRLGRNMVRMAGADVGTLREVV